MREQLAYLYHFFPLKNMPLLRQYGLLSPRALYDVNPSLFEKTIKQTYLKRVAEFVKKPDSMVNNEDVLLYLDTDPKRKKQITSRSIFFSLIPLANYNPLYAMELRTLYGGEISQCLVDIKYLLSFKPIVIHKGLALPKTWSKILKLEFTKQIREDARRVPSGEFPFSYVPHLALECNKVDVGKLVFSKTNKPTEDIMFFPAYARQQLILGKKTMTIKILKGVGKYKQGKTYRCADYDGTLWKVWVRIDSVDNMRIKYVSDDIKKDRHLQADIKKHGVSLEDYCDIIKFKVVKK